MVASCWLCHAVSRLTASRQSVARVHLLSAARPGDPYWDSRAHWDLEAMRESAASDRFGVHSLVEDRAKRTS